jgi:predicted GIY-YIG superfamily endonuclease
MSDYIVYKAISPSNKLYIGITKQSLKDRIYSHKTQARHGRHTPFYMAMRKYNLELKWEVIESNLTQKEAEDKEIYYISLFKTTKREFGYNLSPGGLAGSIMSEAGKKRYKQKMDIHYSNPEYLKKMSEAKRKSLEDPEQYEIAVKAVKNYWSKKESKLKQSQAKGGKPFICIETGDIFNILREVEILGCQGQNVYKVLKGIRKQTKGYTFKYLGEK